MPRLSVPSPPWAWTLVLLSMGSAALAQPAPGSANLTSPPLVIREGIAAEAVHATATDRASAPSPVFARGTASWYGARFHGRRTASGEIFDMHAMTAAHRSLPFGTLVRVRSVATGREVVVRINDRGPASRHRIIDLSYGAARALGLKGRGLMRVELMRE